MIEVNAIERQIFTLLLQTCKTNKLDLTLRVAGGWVRDKLLQRSCKDIDIALDKMLGSQFIVHFADHLRSAGIVTHGFGVIKQNPEKSKHLETATIQLLGYFIDFVNLRGESYTEDSRVPVMTIGSAEEDAWRRDYTLNSLFYNINTEEIEDFTHKGLTDLTACLLRTPLEPRQTFADDPLRVFRGIRFASRFGFRFEDMTFEEMKNADLKRSFEKKISKERVAQEIQQNYKAIETAKSPGRFFQLLHEIEFLPVVCGVKADEKFEEGFKLFEKSLDNFSVFLKRFEYIEEYSIPDLALSLHITLLSYPYFKKDQPLKKQPNYKFVLEQLKLPNKIALLVLTTQKQLQELEFLLDNLDEMNSRLVDLCLWQRETGNIWPVIELIFATKNDVSNNVFLTEFFKQKNLVDFWKTKPLLDGSELKAGLKVQGKEVKEMLTEVFRFQILNPYATSDDFLIKFKK